MEKKRKRPNRKMVIPLPRVVYEEPANIFSRTKASKAKVIKGLDKERGKVPSVYCEICGHPIASRDSRVRFRKGDEDKVLWRHAVCKP